GQIDACNAKAAELEHRLQTLQIQGIKCTTIAIEQDLTTAELGLEAAKQSEADAETEFKTALTIAGKAFDQRDMTDAQIMKDSNFAKSPHPGETSMEGLLSMYSALVRRGETREGLLDAAAGCPGLIDMNALSKGKMTADDIDKATAPATATSDAALD